MKMILRRSQKGKYQLNEAIDNGCWADYRELIRENTGLYRHLISRLHDPEPEHRNKTFRAFEETAFAWPEKRIAELTRKLMWLLNEESGNHCPAAAIALAHIGKVRLNIVLPHRPILAVYTNDPSESIATACREALAMIDEMLSREQRS